MAHRLTKTETVMHAFPRAGGNPSRWYTCPIDPDAPTRDHLVAIDTDLWEDMGCPETITVTIRPGDHLNG